MDVNVGLATLALVETLVLALIGWLLKQFSDRMAGQSRATEKLTEAVGGLATETTEMRVAMFGVSGQNGINSEVKRLRDRQHEIANKVQEIELRVGGLES